MKALRRPGGQPDNDNHSNARRGLPGRLVTQISTPGKLRQSLEARIARDLGHAPSEDEVQVKIKTLALQAIDAYIDSEAV